MLPIKRTTAFSINYDFYSSHHRTVGCKVTHMIGVPMIISSALFIKKNPGLAVGLFGVGWILQFIGHYGYEHNEPVFLEMHSPLTIGSSLLFVGRLWGKFLSGRPL